MSFYLFFIFIYILLIYSGDKAFGTLVHFASYVLWVKHISVMLIHLFLKLLGESNHFVVFSREQKGISLSPKVASVYLFKISMPVGQLF